MNENLGHVPTENNKAIHKIVEKQSHDELSSSYCEPDMDQLSENLCDNDSICLLQDCSEDEYNVDIDKSQDMEEDINVKFSDSTIMFPQSGITVSEVTSMIIGLSLRYYLSHSVRSALLELVNILAGPKFKNNTFSNYNIHKQYYCTDDKILYVFYCLECVVALEEPLLKEHIRKKVLKCMHCNTTFNLSTSLPNRFTIYVLT